MEQKYYTLSDLQSRYEGKTARVIAECSLATELVGGMPADRPAVESFVKYHLNITDETAAAQAVARILNEEVGERDTSAEEGELKEKLSYGINVIRRDEFGPWLGNWMVKACLKAAASRLSIFQQKRGSKGDMAEMGRLNAIGISLKRKDKPERVYLCASDSDSAASTYYQQFKGRIQSPQGGKSIVTDCECAAIGSRFAFEYRYYPVRVKESDIVDVFASAMVIGLGSAKAFERGKFSVNKLTFEDSEAK